MKAGIYKAEYPKIDREFIYQFAGCISGDKNLKDKVSKFCKKFGDEIYSIILFNLTGIKLLPEDAKKAWKGILSHRTHMRMILKRDVKIEVAVLDYFLHIAGGIENPIIIEEKLFNNLRTSVMIDELTGLYNFRYYKKRIEEEIAYAKRYNTRFSIVIFDIDNFKNYNDHFGHLEGNRLLCEIAEMLKKNVRKSDIPIRYAGDEFLLILPHTEKKGAFIVADKLREKIVNKTGNVTVSGGVATFFTDTDKGSDELFNFADKALYRAKLEGKNRVCAYPVERREFKRISLKNRKIKFKIVTPDELNGKMFYADEALPRTLCIEAEIYSKLNKIKFIGEVVWCTKMDEKLYEVGLKFLNISTRNLNIIKGIK